MKSNRLVAVALPLFLIAAGGYLGGCTGRPDIRNSLPPEITDLLPKGPTRPLEVVMASPQGVQNEGDDLKTVTVCFNQPMVPLKPVGSEDGVPPIRIEPSVPGRFRWKGTATVVFEAKDPLPFGTQFKVVVAKGSKSWAGQALANDYSFDFTTPVASVVSSLPVHSNKYASPTGPIFLHFNQPMDAATVAPLLSLESGGKQIPIEVRAQKLEDLKIENKMSERQGSASDNNTSFPSDLIPAKNDPVNDKIVVVIPKEPLGSSSTVNLTLKQGLKGKQGSVGSAKDAVITFKTYGPLGIRNSTSTGPINPDDGLYMEFTNPINTESLAKNLKISPALEVSEYLKQPNVFQDGVNLANGCKPQTEYTITLGADLEDEFGQKLGRDTQVVIKTGDYSPQLLCPEGQGLLESHGPKLLPLGLRNIKSLEATIHRLNRETLIRTLENLDWQDSAKTLSPTSNPRVLKLAANTKQNELQDRSIDFTAADGSFCFIDLKADTPVNSKRLNLQLNNIGITAKYSAENIVIWTTSLDNAKPVVADLEIRDSSGKVLWTGRSGSDGAAQAPGWSALGMTKKDSYDQLPQIYVFAKVGNEEGYICSQGGQMAYPYDFDIPFAWSQSAKKFAATAFSERGLYRAGETVHLKGCLRECKASQWQIADLKEIGYVLEDSRGNEVTKGVIPVNEFGGFNHSIPLGQSAVSGSYHIDYNLPKSVSDAAKIESNLAHASFRVESFTPAQFEVSVKPEKTEYVMGDSAKAQAKGWWLFGAPMNGATVKWTAFISPADLRPSGKVYDGYSFGAIPTFDEHHESESGYKMASGETRLDEKGLKDLTLDLKDIQLKGSAEVMWEANILTAGGQELSGRSVLPVHRGEFQIGLKSTSSLVTVGEKSDLEVVTVAPDSKAVSGKPVKIELLRRDYKSVRKAGPDGRYEWTSEIKDEPLNSQDATSTAEPLKVQISPTKAGMIVVRATSTDGRKNQIVSETVLYASGNDTVGWKRSDGDNIGLVPDKLDYKPNDTAKIMVQSPFETAQALITVERENVIERYVQELKGNSPTIEIKIRSQHLPNVFVGVVLVKGRVADKGFGPDGQDLGKPSFKMGYCNLPVDSSQKHLDVKLKTDKTTYKPGEEVTVEAEVQTADHQGVQAEMSLAVADEGVLKLIDYKTPDFFSTFYGTRALSVLTGQTLLDLIGQRAYGSKGANAGGGGGDSDVRQDFKPTAYWNASIITDAQGKAKTKFKLPDNLTSFRLMGVAQTKASDFGSGEANLNVKKDLMLISALPSFARVGDELQGGVVVHNNSSASMTVEVDAEAKGIELSGNAHQSVTVAAGKEQMVGYLFKPKETATAQVTFRAKAQGQEDALKLPISIEKSVVTETVATSSSFEDNSAIELAVPQPIAAGSGFLQVELYPSLLQNLKANFEDNLTFRYDFGGVYPERLLLLSANRTLAKSLGYDEQKQKEIVEASLKTLKTYQRSDGGFMYSHESDTTSVALTCRVLEALAAVAKTGTAIDPQMLKEVKEYAKRELNSASKVSGPYAQNSQWDDRCYGAYVMALHGLTDAANINKLYSEKGNMSILAKIYLARAAQHLPGCEATAHLLCQDIRNKATVEASTAYFEQSASPGIYPPPKLDLTALALTTLMQDKDGLDMAPKVVKWMLKIDTKKGNSSTPMSNVLLVEALAAYGEKFEREAPNNVSRVNIGKEEILKTTFKSRDDKSVVKSVTISDKDDKLPVKFSKSGQGRLYYNLRMSYATAQEQPARDEGLAVFKSISDVASGRRINEFKAGEKYMVTVTVVTPRDRDYVALTDPIPAGFDVLQTNFNTESAEMTRLLAKASNQGPTRGGTFSGFEKYNDRIQFLSDHLSAGEHTFRYMVRANYVGKYSTPATKVEEMFHQEVFGTTAAGQWTIR